MCALVRVSAPVSECECESERVHQALCSLLKQRQKQIVISLVLVFVSVVVARSGKRQYCLSHKKKMSQRPNHKRTHTHRERAREKYLPVLEQTASASEVGATTTR